MSSRAAEAVASATGALSALQSSSIGNGLEALVAPLFRSEALGSSFTEGLRASNKRLAVATYEPRVADFTALAVLGNVNAMEKAIEIGF
ncbi:MAG: hypothetical protein HKL80_02075 [Acidimicrobiales bacterium]|nr:hypothetical protein [Acidimicrobiales bacterium]